MFPPEPKRTLALSMDYRDLDQSLLPPRFAAGTSSLSKGTVVAAVQNVFKERQVAIQVSGYKVCVNVPNSSAEELTSLAMTKWFSHDAAGATAILQLLAGEQNSAGMVMLGEYLVRSKRYSLIPKYLRPTPGFVVTNEVAFTERLAWLGTGRLLDGDLSGACQDFRSAEAYGVTGGGSTRASCGLAVAYHLQGLNGYAWKTMEGARAALRQHMRGYQTAAESILTFNVAALHAMTGESFDAMVALGPLLPTAAGRKRSDLTFKIIERLYNALDAHQPVACTNEVDSLTGYLLFVPNRTSKRNVKTPPRPTQALRPKVTRTPRSRVPHGN